MEINVTQNHKKAVLNVAGDVDEQGAEELKRQFQSLDLNKLDEVILDMGRVNYLGSSGIGKLLLFYKNLAVKDKNLSVINLNPQLYELFEELKLQTLFSISKT